MLNFRDVTALPPYRNLVLRFRGEENPRARIGTVYLNQRKKIKIVGAKESLDLRMAYPSADKAQK
jgi:hypothetical protein